METHTVKVGFDAKNGFIGTKVASETSFECTNFDKLLLMHKDGSYSVINIPEKQYVQQHHPVVFAGIADKKSIVRVVYRDPKTDYCYVKRFVVSKFILDKSYRFLDEGMKLEFLTTDDRVVVELEFKPQPKQKTHELEFNLDSVAIKGATAKGVRMANKPVKKVRFLKQSKSSKS